MTIRDIAEMTGVSVATVSRVINGNGYVKEVTKRKVQKAIEESNYRPNAVARSLIRKETSMIGLIMPGRVNPFFSNIIDGVETRAEKMNQNVLFYNTLEEPEKEHRAIRQVMEQQVQGIMIFPIVGSDDETRRLLEEAESSGIPVVLVDRDLENALFDAVFIDNRAAVYEGTKAFLDAGHEKIGVITCPDNAKPGYTRLDGYLKCLRDNGIPVREEYIYRGDFDQESGYKACGLFMEMEDPPTAVLATNSSETLGSIRYFNERQMRLGKEIGLIGFDDIATLNLIGYPITVIDRPMKEMGEMAYEILMERVEKPGKVMRTKEIILKTRMIFRGSECCDRVPKEEKSRILK